jgi:hypothetical protein
MFYSKVFNLSLVSNKRLPVSEQFLGSESPDICLNWVGSDFTQLPKLMEGSCYVSPFLNQDGQSLFTLWKSADGGYFRFQYSDGVEFVINRCADKVWGAWSEPSSLENASAYFFDTIMAFILRLRGVTCLHASAVAIEDQAVIFIGPAGAGKSTTAAAFSCLGYPVLADDAAALMIQDNNFFVPPAYPILRLRPESAEALYVSADLFPRPVPGWNKCFVDLNEQGYSFQEKPLPLAAIYFLQGRQTALTEPVIEALDKQAGLIKLVTNTYIRYVLDNAMRAADFKLLADIADRLPLQQITSPQNLDQLPRLCEAILKDLNQMSRS